MFNTGDNNTNQAFGALASALFPDPRSQLDAQYRQAQTSRTQALAAQDREKTRVLAERQAAQHAAGLAAGQRDVANFNARQGRGPGFVGPPSAQNFAQEEALSTSALAQALLAKDGVGFANANRISQGTNLTLGEVLSGEPREDNLRIGQSLLSNGAAKYSGTQGITIGAQQALLEQEKVFELEKAMLGGGDSSRYINGKKGIFDTQTGQYAGAGGVAGAIAGIDPNLPGNGAPAARFNKFGELNEAMIQAQNGGTPLSREAIFAHSRLLLDLNPVVQERVKVKNADESETTVLAKRPTHELIPGTLVTDALAEIYRIKPGIVGRDQGAGQSTDPNAGRISGAATAQESPIVAGAPAQAPQAQEQPSSPLLSALAPEAQPEGHGTVLTPAQPDTAPPVSDPNVAAPAQGSVADTIAPPTQTPEQLAEQQANAALEADLRRRYPDSYVDPKAQQREQQLAQETRHPDDDRPVDHQTYRALKVSGVADFFPGIEDVKSTTARATPEHGSRAFDLVTKAVPEGALTELQSKYAVYTERLAFSFAGLVDQLNYDPVKGTFSRKPFRPSWVAQKLFEKGWDGGIVGGLGTSSNDKIYFRNAQGVLQAIMRADSGAAIPESEIPRYFRELIPQAWDPPELIRDKLDNIAITLQAFAEVSKKIKPPNANGKRRSNPNEVYAWTSRINAAKRRIAREMTEKLDGKRTVRAIITDYSKVGGQRLRQA